MPDKVPVFISYAREDSATARRLFVELQRMGTDPWLDSEKLLPGQRWKVAIKQAIRRSRYFIAVLSTKAVTKRGVVQSELKQALEILDEFPEADIFIIPVRLDDCAPSHDRLRELNWVDLFPSFLEGMQKIHKLLVPDSPPAPSEATLEVTPHFYVYVSDVKLVMLSSQLPDGVKLHLAGELGLDENLLRASAATQPLTPSARYVLARLVERYLVEQEQVGTVDKPKAYFRGELSLKWGGYKTELTKWDEPSPSPLVYFGGGTKDTIVGLGGSAHHVIGAPVSSYAAHSHSATPYMVATLYAGLELPLPKADEAALKQTERHFGKDPSRNIAMAVALATTQMVGTEQRLRFLARRLAFFPRHTHSAWPKNMNILLGTPLYVSLSE